MRLSHFHALGRYLPDGRIEIDLGPAGLPQFARSNENMGCNLKRELCDPEPFVTVDRAKQLAGAFRIGDGAIMCNLGRRQCAAEVPSRIRTKARGCYRIAENQPCQLKGAACAFKISALFDLANGGENIGRLDLGDRKFSNRPAQLGQQVFRPLGRGGRPTVFAVLFPLRAIFVRYLLKGVSGIECGANFLALLLARWVFA